MNIEQALENAKRIHFIGIGGSGMCPLAEILHEKGYYLTGSDNNETDTLKRIRNLGIPVTLGQKAENVDGADMVVLQGF
jgi:UDP-N-acetylmuramate--alanine ligase